MIKQIHVFLFFCLAIFALLCILSIRHLNLTYDEDCHYGYGQRILLHHPAHLEILDYTKMPFDAINVGCSQAVTHFVILNDPVKAGRYATIIAGMILAFYVFQWSYQLYGAVPALFSLFLFSFDPNIIAHSRLVTLDLYVALMMTVSLYYFWRFLKLGGWKNGLISALVLGISQSAKYTCLALYPLCFLIGMVKYVESYCEFKRQRDYKSIRTLTIKLFAYGGMFIAVGILMINVSFGFVRTGTLLKNYRFDGRLCRSLQSVTLFRECPIPLPYDYIRGIDMVDLCQSKGDGYGNIYLLGHLKDKSKGDIKGFGGYYFFVYLFKTPLASQAIILLALFHYCFYRRWRFFMTDEIFLILPLLCLGVFINFFINAQIGIRYILFYFPLLYVFSGNLFVRWYKFKASVKAFFLVLLIYLAISTLSYFPHFISYFNEIVWDRKQAHKFLADSNLDWGGEQWYADQYMKKHPETIFEPSKPMTGRIMVTVNELTGVNDSEKFKWLRENYEPVEQVAHVYLIYNVKTINQNVK